VRFSVEREADHAVCRVQDQGIGIPEPDLARIFSAFHRGRNVGQVSGSGLGLVIVKRCVELHGGTIRVDSKLGTGTTVTVRLPLFENLSPAGKISSTMAAAPVGRAHE
jgi:signal transduction histidine kinase